MVTAGQPLMVLSAPGWDAPVSYEIADGSWVTVGGDAIAAPDGSMWYPVDGGFVPVDSVSSAAPVENSFEYFQTADETWTDPNAVPLDTSGGWVDPTTGEWVTQDVATEQWVDPNAGQEISGWIDPNTGEWVDATQQAPAETWVDPNAATTAWVDPNAATDVWVDPNAVTTTDGARVDPNVAAPAEVAVDSWVDPNAPVDGWIDPNTGEWVTAAPQDLATAPAETWVDPNAATAAAPANGYVDPVTGQWVVTMAQEAVTDPAAEQYVEPATEQYIDPAAEQYVEPVAEAPVTDAAVAAPATSGEWIDPAATDQTWVDPNAATDSWVDPNAVTTTDGSWVDPNAPVATDVAVQPDAATDEWIAPAPQEMVVDDGSSWEPEGTWTEVTQKGSKKNKNRNRGNAGVDGTATASGQSMVSFAMQYVGYPYAYAGEGPYAFDCSGFTKFVAQNTLGIDITHDMFTQIGMGSSVDRGGLVPGDLVFFANTFRPGLSHTGIYIGDGQFVHAENESTGVVVSDLNSDYYSSRWYGATRLA